MMQITNYPELSRMIYNLITVLRRRVSRAHFIYVRTFGRSENILLLPFWDLPLVTVYGTGSCTEISQRDLSAELIIPFPFRRRRCSIRVATNATVSARVDF
jgi:hypothetical protein